LGENNITQSGNYTISIYTNDTNNNKIILTQNFSVTTNAPQIILAQPSESAVTIRKNRTIVFNITASDPANEILNYFWIIDGEENSTQQNYTLNTTNLNAGNYNLIARIENNNSNTTRYWNLTILNPNINISFNSSTNISTISWTRGNNNTNAINFSNYFVNTDNETITYVLVNSSNITMTTIGAKQEMASFIVPTLTYAGVEYVWINANDSESNATSNVFLLQVNEPAPEEEEDDEQSGGSGGGGGGGGSTGPLNYYSEIFQEAEGIISVRNKISANVAINSVEFLLNKKVTNAKIKIIQNKETNHPKEISELNKNVKLYASFTIEHANIEDNYIERALINFTVTKNWIKNNSANYQNIALYRYNNNKFTKLKTIYIEENAQHYSFQAESPGLSIFAIGEEQGETQNKFIETEERLKNESISLTITEETFKNNTIENESNTLGEKNMNYAQSMVFVKIGAAILSVIAILAVITIIDRIAKKNVQKAIAAEEKERKLAQEKKKAKK
jgi:PGF-pre-PGF domain-containing protein